MSVMDFGEPGTSVTPQPEVKICKTCGHDRSEHPYDDVCWASVIVDGKAELCRCRKFELKAKPKARQAASGH